MTQDTTVPQGYKQTELGVLPVEWEAKTFGDVMTGFSSGATPYRPIKRFYDGKIKWVTSGELNYNIITDTIEHISSEAVKSTNLRLLPKGTFLMAITGLEAAGTRGSCAILGTEATTNQSCMALFPSNGLTTEFLYYYYLLHGDALALQFCQGTKQQSYTGAIVKRLPIVIPPLPEQRAIAAALGAVDALLAAQRARLAKQRAVKQGLLQTLLRGEKRLPGFGGTWEVRRLGDLFAFLTTANNSRADLTDEGEIAYLHYGDIHTKFHLFLDVSRSKMPYLKQDKVRRGASLLRDGDLVIADASEDYEGVGKGVEIMSVGDKKLVAGLHTILLRPTSGLTVQGYRGYMLLYPDTRQHIQNMATGVSVYGITKANLRTTPVYLPPLDEQRAIAAVLNATDAALAALEAEHAKTHLLKQGLMQDLLTGRLRLPLP